MNTPKRPCQSCIYKNACGDSTRTAPCQGRKTKREQKKEKRDERTARSNEQ